MFLGRTLVVRNSTILLNKDIPSDYNSSKSNKNPAEYVVNKLEAAWHEYLIAFYPKPNNASCKIMRQKRLPVK